MYSAVCIEFNVASCGYTIEEAYKNVIEAVEIYLNDARELGTLNEILVEAGFDLPENLTDNVVIQPEYVMFGSPFIAVEINKSILHQAKMSRERYFEC